MERHKSRDCHLAPLRRVTPARIFPTPSPPAPAIPADPICGLRDLNKLQHLHPVIARLHERAPDTRIFVNPDHSVCATSFAKTSLLRAAAATAARHRRVSARCSAKTSRAGPFPSASRKANCSSTDNRFCPSLNRRVLGKRSAISSTEHSGLGPHSIQGQSCITPTRTRSTHEQCLRWRKPWQSPVPPRARRLAVRASGTRGRSNAREETRTPGTLYQFASSVCVRSATESVPVGVISLRPLRLPDHFLHQSRRTYIPLNYRSPRHCITPHAPKRNAGHPQPLLQTGSPQRIEPMATRGMYERRGHTWPQDDPMHNRLQRKLLGRRSGPDASPLRPRGKLHDC